MHQGGAAMRTHRHNGGLGSDRSSLCLPRCPRNVLLSFQQSRRWTTPRTQLRTCTAQGNGHDWDQGMECHFICLELPGVYTPNPGEKAGDFSANGSSDPEDHSASAGSSEQGAQDGLMTEATGLKLLEAVEQNNCLLQKACKLPTNGLSSAKASTSSRDLVPPATGNVNGARKTSLANELQVDLQVDITVIACALMQRNAFPTKQEVALALNNAIGGSSDKQCKQMVGRPTKWNLLRKDLGSEVKAIRSATSKRVRDAAKLHYAGGNVFREDGKVVSREADKLLEGDAYRVQGSDPYGNSCFQGVLRDAFPDRVPKGYITGPITWLGRSDVAFAANRVRWLLLGYPKVPNRRDGKAGRQLYPKYREMHDIERQKADNTADTPTMQWLTGA